MLAVPKDGLHGPSGNGPDELFIGCRVPGVLFHRLERAIDHRGAVLVLDIAGEGGIADVEVTLHHEHEVHSIRGLLRPDRPVRVASADLGQRRGDGRRGQ